MRPGGSRRTFRTGLYVHLWKFVFSTGLCVQGCTSGYGPLRARVRAFACTIFIL